MAKDKRIVAGVISDTKYYYASDGSVVDEDGKPAPAKFAAMFPPMPEQKAEPEKPAKETKPKKTRRKLKDLAGRIKNSKYYYDAEGNVVDEEGKPVNEKLAGYFGKREELRKDIPKVEPKKQTDMIDEKKFNVINSEIGKAIRSTKNLVQSDEIIQDKMIIMFDSFNDVVKTLGDQNDAIVQRLIQQNQEFQDKVIETLTGVPSATKAGGAKPKKINPRAVGGSKAARGTELKVKTTNYREDRKKEVEDRARRIAIIKKKRDVQAIVVGSLIGATAGVGAGAIISAITPSGNAPSTPTPPGGAPGGTTPSGPGGGNGDTTPGSGGMTRLKTKDGYPYEVESKFAANFKGFVDELEASGYKIKRGGIGGYSARPGWHGKGMAIDINPDDNPMLINSGGRIINKLTGRESSDLRNSKYPFGYGKDNFGSIDVGAMARKWGLGWGGNWPSSSDTMHFSAGRNEGGTGVVTEGSPQVTVGGGAAPAAPGAPAGSMTVPPSNVPLGSSRVAEGEAGERPRGKAGFKQIMESAKKAGDPFPEVVAAQWAIESNWGEHMTGKNNPFGQTGVEGKDPGIRIPTPRDPGGGSKFFRSFESIDEAIAFRVKKWAPKYAGAKTAEEALMMLQNYGKTPRYAQGFNNDWMGYVTSVSNTIRGQGIDPKVAKGPGGGTPGSPQPTQTASGPSAPAGSPQPAPAPAPAQPQTGTGGVGSIQAPGGSPDVSSPELTVKGGMNGQAFAGGAVHPATLKLAGMIQSSVQGFDRFTGFNDKYHEGTNSRHAKGLAGDFTVSNPAYSAAAAEMVRQIAKQLGASVYVIDEYKNPSSRATAGHIHYQFTDQRSADLVMGQGQTQVAAAGAPPKAYAAGDPYVPNTGPAIVGERGPELVVGKDGSSRVTGAGAHVENLNQGDSVVPADKTKKMLPAYAGGTSELMLDSDWQPYLDKEKHARYMGGRPDTMSDDERNEYEGFKTKKQYGNKDSLWNQKVAHPNAEAAAQGYTADRGDAEEWDIIARLKRGERVDPNKPPETMTKRELASRITEYGMPGLISGAYKAEEFAKITREAGQFQWQTDAEEKFREAEKEKKKPQPERIRPLVPLAPAAAPANTDAAKPSSRNDWKNEPAQPGWDLESLDKARLPAYADGTKPPKKTGKPIKQPEPVDNTAEIGLSLLKTGVSFIPVVGQVVAGLDAANELRKGNIGGALKAGLGAIPGGGIAAGVGKMVAGEVIDRVDNKLSTNSEQNAIKEYTKPPAVKTVVINNNRTNNVTKTVSQGSSLPQFDRKESANPLAQGGNKRTAMGAF